MPAVSDTRDSNGASRFARRIAPATASYRPRGTPCSSGNRDSALSLRGGRAPRCLPPRGDAHSPTSRARSDLRPAARVIFQQRGRSLVLVRSEGCLVAQNSPGITDFVENASPRRRRRGSRPSCAAPGQPRGVYASGGTRWRADTASARRQPAGQARAATARAATRMTCRTDSAYPHPMARNTSRTWSTSTTSSDPLKRLDILALVRSKVSDTIEF